MKKSIIALFVLLLLPISLTACVNQVNENAFSSDISSPGTAISEDVVPSREISSKTDTSSEMSKSLQTVVSSKLYNIDTAEYINDKIKIVYPQVTDMADKNKQKALNDIIYQNILDQAAQPFLNTQSNNSQINDLIIELDYKITLGTDDLISILYTGKSKTADNADEHYEVYSTTIDLVKMTKIKLTDIVPVNFMFVDKIYQSEEEYDYLLKEYKPSATNLYTYTYSVNDATLLKAFKEQYPYHNAFCLTPDALIVSVGIDSPEGDFMLVALKGTYADDYLKAVPSNEKQKNYSYKIKTTVDKTYPTDKGGEIQYTFSRPVFTENSALAKTVNKIYAQAEAAYKKRMEQEVKTYENISPVEVPDDYLRFFTQICEVSYEKDGIVSFILYEEWYMGGVYNKMIYGHTFDFNLSRELKIKDVLYGNQTQITESLENEFRAWFKQKNGFDLDEDIKNATNQSGGNANFFLTDDGVHVFYKPYTISMTQDGIDIFLPWTRTDLVRDIRKSK